MRVWKLTADKYCIKKRLARAIFDKLLAIDGVSYKQEEWQIEFNQQAFLEVDKFLGPLDVIKGEKLLKHLYRISKYQSRRELMSKAVTIYEYRDYVYFILTELNQKLLAEHEGQLLVNDPKVKEYATELRYLSNLAEEIEYYKDQLAEISIAEIIEVINQPKGSILNRDPDSSPYLFLAKYQDLTLNKRERKQLFKQELSLKPANAMQIERLADKRGVKKEVWKPIFTKQAEAEIEKRLKRLDKLVAKEAKDQFFTDQESLKLAYEIESLAQRMEQRIDDYLSAELLEAYLSKQEEFY